MENPLKKTKNKDGKKKHHAKTASFQIAPYKQFPKLVAYFFLLVALAVAGHMYLYYRLETHDIFSEPSSPSSSAPVVNQQKLTGVLTRYANKKTARVSAVTLTPSVSDPSL